MKTNLRHMVNCNKPNNQWSFSYITPKSVEGIFTYELKTFN